MDGTSASNRQEELRAWFELPEEASHFDLLQLGGEVMNPDPAELESEFYRLSRACHPDFFATKSPGEKSRAERMSTRLNDAYRVLKEPARRVQYLLEQYGDSGAENQRKVPAPLLELVFELQEQRQAFEAGDAAQQTTLRPELEAAAQRVATERTTREERINELCARWDAEEDTRDELRKTMRQTHEEQAYLNKLQRRLEETFHAAPNNSGR